MLKRLQIRNFRGFNDLTIDQLSGLNLIAGKNSSGKTSLLGYESSVASEKV